jgi:uncharacterized repeat protein (TIGR01451 family)
MRITPAQSSDSRVVPIPFCFRLLMSMRSMLFPVCLLIAIPMAHSASVPGTPEAESAGKISPETWRKVRSGELRDLLVEFHDFPDLHVSARRQPGRRDANSLAQRREHFERLKSGSLGGLGTGAVELKRDFKHLPMTYLHVRDAEALRALLEQSGVKAVYPLRRAQPLAATLDLIAQPQAAQLLGQTGAGTVVAVLDTGVNFTSSTFGSCTAPGVPAASCKVVAALDTGTDDGSRDDNGHGTSVAGIVLNAAPGTGIAAIDVCDPTWGCNNVTIVEGIDWAIANQETYNIVAINISLGGGAAYADPCTGNASYGVEAAVAEASDAGILTLGASGNNSYVNGINWPACAPGVVSVGAVYDSNVSNCTPGVKDSVACFSNVSDYLSLLTPASATSYAAPLAAGATAVMAAAFPLESTLERANRLTTTGKPVIDNRSGSPVGLGWVIPRLDMAAALLYPDTAAPDNDNFNAATQISGDSGSLLGWNYFASQEAGEPQHAAGLGGKSVWWQWTAGASGSVGLDTHGSNFDTLLAVYSGAAVEALFQVAANDDDGGAGGVSGLSFHADAGATYRVAVDGKAGVTGSLFLNRSFTADAANIANLSISLGGSPDPVAVGASLTYTFSVANSGPALAHAVSVSHFLPAGASLIAAGAGCTHLAGTLSCVLGDLAAGQQASRSSTVSLTNVGLAQSLATVSSSSPDGNPGNDTASISTTVNAAVGGDSSSAGDVPLPLWSALLLGLGMLSPLLRRNRQGG